MTRTHWITWLGALALVAVLTASQTSCTQTDCGTGTIDKSGKCVPADDTAGNAACGEGTHLGSTGKCEPDQIVQCDPGSTTAEEDPTTHVITCIGTGTKGCGSPISCPSATTGHMTICGQLLDIGDSMPIAASPATGSTCDPANPTPDGPCALDIKAYDAIDFATNGQASTPLPTEEIVIDDCGRFRIKNITPQGASYVGIGLENNAKVTTVKYRLTGVALPTQLGKSISGFPGYGVQIATDQHWTQTAGLPSSPTFVQQGMYMGIFLHGTAPVAGVKVTHGGATDAANDYYFSDTAANSRVTIDPAQNSTGADGSGIAIGANMNLTQYSGTGGEPSNCKWPSDLGDQITNVAFIQPRVAVKSADITMTCP